MNEAPGFMTIQTHAASLAKMPVSHCTLVENYKDPFTVGKLVLIFPQPTDNLDANDKRVFEEMHRITQ